MVNIYKYLQTAIIYGIYVSCTYTSVMGKFKKRHADNNLQKIKVETSVLFKIGATPKSLMSWEN